jgi:hypothetical protein
LLLLLLVVVAAPLKEAEASGKLLLELTPWRV